MVGFSNENEQKRDTPTIWQSRTTESNCVMLLGYNGYSMWIWMWNLKKGEHGSYLNCQYRRRIKLAMDSEKLCNQTGLCEAFTTSYDYCSNIAQSRDRRTAIMSFSSISPALVYNWLADNLLKCSLRTLPLKLKEIVHSHDDHFPISNLLRNMNC